MDATDSGITENAPQCVSRSESRSEPEFLHRTNRRTIAVAINSRWPVTRHFSRPEHMAVAGNRHTNR